MRERNVRRWREEKDMEDEQEDRERRLSRKHSGRENSVGGGAGKMGSWFRKSLKERSPRRQPSAPGSGHKFNRVM